MDRDEIHEGHKRGLLTSQEKLVLLKREDGWTFQHIADEYGYTLRYAEQVAQRAGKILLVVLYANADPLSLGDVLSLNGVQDGLSNSLGRSLDIGRGGHA